MSTDLLAPSFDAPRGEPVGDWRPARYTQTLTGTEDFATAADGLLTLLVVVGWVTVEGPLQLDDWQVWLLRHLLELYPADWPVEHLRGRLRYKRVVVSMGRQNGKSVLGAILAFYFLTRHVKGAKVGSFASREEQAGIVYERVRFAVDSSAQLKANIRATLTRGISSVDGTRLYKTFPAKADSLQGEPFTAALYDELHLGNMALWDAIVLGQRSKPHAMLVGLTTAGNDGSLLLKRLYTEGAAAIEAAEQVTESAAACLSAAITAVEAEYARLVEGTERFGFFCWESPTEEFGPDYEPTPADVIAANPAIACGRIPLADAMQETRTMWRSGPDEDGVTGRDRVIRYTFNRFTEGVGDAWTSQAAWKALAAELPDPGSDVVYGVQRTGDWEAATITANWREDERHYTRIVATVVEPSLPVLVRACKALNDAGAGAFAMPARTLKPLALALRDEGVEAWMLADVEEQAAAALLKGLVRSRSLTHAGDPLLRVQSSWARVKRTDDGWRFSEGQSVGDIDALRATAAGTYVAAQREHTGLQLY